VTLPVSVNLSRVDVFDPSLEERLESLVERYGLDHKALKLEVTESAYTENAEQMIELINRLRGRGFEIEMDDFGSGYSSLNMLTKLPIDALKLDMQFVRTAFGEKKDTRLLEAMMQLAEAFRLTTIAEGVETEEQFRALRDMGCDVMQGYYFSKPLPQEEFEAFLLAHRPG